MTVVCVIICCNCRRSHSPRVACIARAIKLMEVANGHIDHGHVVLLLGAPLPLPDECPRDNDDKLSGQEQCTGNDETERVDATARQLFILDKYFCDRCVASIVACALHV